MRLKTKIKLLIIMLTPAMVLLSILSKGYPKFIERYYSNTFNKIIREVLSLITGLFPFSIAEILYYSLILILIGSFVVLLIRIKKGGFINQLLNIGAYLSTLYVLFMILWGFNYNRLSFDKISGLKIEKSSEGQLLSLCEELVDRANSLREKVQEDSQGVMIIQGGYKSVFRRGAQGYKEASTEFPELAGAYGIPKPVLLSEKMCYTGITGMYMPYTGEANVNVHITDFMLPCTAMHEMAHQRGFAREDEANFISYVACIRHPDADFQYSGIMLALVNSVNALYGKDKDAYKILAGKYSKGVRRDLQNDAAFWEKYRGKIEEVSNNVNNTYLKSNGQNDGVESYGRMVDLLLAEFKSRQK